MIAILSLLIISIGLFVRECKKDKKRSREQERLSNEHVMREIEKFKKEKGIQ